MTSESSNTADGGHGHVFAWLLFPLALFPLMALLTYDARVYTEFPAPPSSNWIGALGDSFAHYGYLLFGLAIWVVPVLCVIAGFRIIGGRRLSTLRRCLWFLVLISALSCLAQVLSVHDGLAASLSRRINISAPGGAVGYLLMTRALSPLLSDFGASILMSSVAVIALVAAIGPRNIAAAFSGIFLWARGAATRPEPRQTPADARLPAEAARDAYEAARAAKEAARRQREEEKARIREAKLREKEAKLREKEERRAAKEAEKLARYEARLRLENGDYPTAAPAPAEKPAPQAEVRRPEPAAEQPPPQQQPEVEDKGPYLLPPLSLLNPIKKSLADHGDVGEMTHRLIDTLKLFGVDATLAYTVEGPVVTKYAIRLEPGTRYSAVTNISDNLMGALHARSLRIEAPIPGEDCVGIEVPNRAPAGISFREIIESEAWKKSKGELPLLFGKRADGTELVADLASMPHMLVAGATGQGKSVCLNALINGLLMTRTPEQLKLIMVDPKSVEFTASASLPHLIVPVITDNKKVVFSLRWAVQEMEKRPKLFPRARVRHIYDFNHRLQLTQTDMFGNDSEVGSDMPKTVPYIVIIIDEVADLMSSNGKAVTPDSARRTAKARAAGIHLILATQRPDAKIITGTIKANIPGRVAFKTATSIDSRTILDDSGAENLIGRGDMLFKSKDGLLIRAQGAWISDPEIANIIKFIEQHSNVQFDDRFAKKLGTIKEEEVDLFADPAEDAANAKAEAESAREQVKAEENASDFKKAVECIINTNRASTSHFQRKLGWGYNHSAKIMDMLEDAGIIGPQSGAGPRQIIMDQQQLLDIFNGTGGATAAEGDSTPDSPPANDLETPTEENI